MGQDATSNRPMFQGPPISKAGKSFLHSLLDSSQNTCTFLLNPHVRLSMGIMPQKESWCPICRLHRTYEGTACLQPGEPLRCGLIQITGWKKKVWSAALWEKTLRWNLRVPDDMEASIGCSIQHYISSPNFGLHIQLLITLQIISEGPPYCGI